MRSCIVDLAMMLLEMAVPVAVGAVVAVANAVTTRRLWTSAMFERPQKIAQTIMIWVLPGSFVVTRLLLGVAPPRDGDPTAFRLEGGDSIDDAGSYHHHGEDFR
jgi:hypothetical protein